MLRPTNGRDHAEEIVGLLDSTSQNESHAGISETGDERRMQNHHPSQSHPNQRGIGVEGRPNQYSQQPPSYPVPNHYHEYYSNQPPSSYYNSQPNGFGHAYHSPPQYNSQQTNHHNPLAGGIHYSYLLLMAISFATVVQISKGGLFAYNSTQQRTPFVYPAASANLRYPNGFSNYYMANNNNNGMMFNNGQQQGTMMNNQMMNGGMMTQQNQQGTPINQQQASVAPVDTSSSFQVQQPITTVVADVAPQQEPAAEISTSTTFDAGSEGKTYELAELSNFKDNWDEWEPSDTPVFFHIPKAGGSTIKDIIGTCHRFIMATEAGVTDGHGDDVEIAVVYPGGGPAGQDRSPFVNVDTTTVAGIQRAQQMGFADSGLADAVVTPFIYETNDLFTPTAKGRLFTVFRHPIDRAISMFYYLQVADWEPTYDPELKNWSIEEYATSDRIENNWLTRQLSNQLAGELTEDDLTLALEVVRRKFFVGLMGEIEATMGRCERFFRWTYHVNPTNQEKCREALLSGGSNSNSANKKAKPEPGSNEWDLLAWQNQFDLRLYEYIEQLFQEQQQFVDSIPDDFRNIDSTCCKCDPPTFPPEGFECPKAILF
mmetsp:Transcript_17249/g.21078  ORF Transcript_17249/g.21078 Transcript_17249/m.21078 type:complete len:599 (+) Transcript_17249:157-1953(+)